MALARACKPAEGAAALVSTRERGELNQLVVELESRPDDALAADTDVLAEPDRRLPSMFGSCDPVEKRRRDGDRRRPTVEAFECIQAMYPAALFELISLD